MEALKNIWTVADQPPTQALDQQKFAVAVRLIQLLQNGQKGQGAHLEAPPGVLLRPPFFEGVSGVSVPMPNPAAPPSNNAPASPTGGSYVSQPPNLPGTPTRPPLVPTRALAPQDPYTMSPSEQSRYEAIFPEYAKEGYVYGPEAVSLFSKSGLPPQQLAAIWNMADHPVDNRLDKAEFAIAMHMIVCVTKKNLPLPASLPGSLLQLKSQQQSNMMRPVSPEQARQRTGTLDSTNVSNVIQTQPADHQQQQQQSQVGAGISRPPSTIQTTTQSLGGMSISDAFEGLNTTNNDNEQVPSFDGSWPETEQLSTVPEVVTAESPPLQPAPAAKPTETPKTTAQLAKTYKMGEPNEELEKLKTTLQKLQAENISLKAQLGSVTEEEKDVQKELGATVAEISKLSNELTNLRAQVVAAKSKLLQATGELKAAIEKKG